MRIYTQTVSCCAGCPNEVFEEDDEGKFDAYLCMAMRDERNPSRYRWINNRTNIPGWCPLPKCRGKKS